MKRLILSLLAFFCAFATFAQNETQYKLTHYDEYDGLSQRYITQIVQGDDGFIWIGTWNGLNRFDGYDFVKFKSCDVEGNRLPSDRFLNIVKTADGNLLCQIDGQLYVFDVRTSHYKDILTEIEEKVGAELKVENVYSIGTGELFFECDNELVITTTAADVVGNAVLHNRAEVQLPSYPITEEKYPSLVANNIEYIYSMTDEDGIDWLRSNFGLYKMIPVQRDIYKKLYTENSALIRCLFQDKTGRFWVTGKDDKTVRIYDQSQRLIGFLRPDGTISQKFTSFGIAVYCIYQDKNNDFWFGSKPDGLFQLKEREKGFEISSVIPGDGHENFGVWDVKEDRFGRLWVAEFGNGLVCLSPEKEILGTPLLDQHQAGNLARHLLLTEKQELLVATTEGLFVADISEPDFEKIRFRRHCYEKNRTDCLSNDATMFLFQDHNGAIYVCTESGGVNRIDSENLLSEDLSFTHYNTSTGFPTDIALSMFEYDGYLGIVSNNELVRFNPETEESISFDHNFFKADFRFSDAVPLSLSDGKWMFGLQEGAIVLNLNSMKKSDFIPKVAITGVSIQNGEIDYAVNHKDTIILNKDERCLTLYFAALDYAADNSLRYSFCLDDGTWNFLDKNHSATLLDLQPGTYRMKIRSTNHDLVWVDNERTVTIVVEPAWWETIYAKILYCLLVLAFIASVVGVINHIRKINIRQKNLEAYLAFLEHDQQQKQLMNNNETQAEQAVNDEKDAELQLFEKAQIKAVDDVFMKRILAFVEQHIDDPEASIGDMAEAAATSLAGLNRKLKQILGTTPNEFLREARIQKACVLLKDPSVSINDIAFLCGFSDSKYFSRSFKSKKGISPSEYRAEFVK